MKLSLEFVNQNIKLYSFVPKEFQPQVMEQLQAVAKKLESGTECLIMGDVIGIGDYYKLCTVKSEHIISFESWLKLNSRQCCYCKGEMFKEIFCNS